MDGARHRDIGGRRIFVEPKRLSGMTSGGRQSLFLATGSRSRDFAGAHQVANVFLQEFVVVVQLVVLFPDGFKSVEEGNERILESLCVSLELIACLFAHSVNVLATPSRTHGTDIVGTKVGIDGSDGRAVAGDDERATAHALGEVRARRDGLVDRGLIVFS
jgi:hypothetical protein